MSRSSKDHPEGTIPVAQNRRARFDYAIEETLEAGIVLVGSEVKSLRNGSANLSDAYALPERGELWLLHLNIAPYKAASALGHEPTRKRKLLVHRREFEKLQIKVHERGWSLIPLSLYFKNGVAKVELALARGKSHEDRRESIKERETQRELDRALDQRRHRHPR